MENIIITDKKNRNWLIEFEPFELGGYLFINMYVVSCGAPLYIRAGLAGYCVEHDGRAKLNNIEVSPKYQGNGIGSRLLEEVEKSAAQIGITNLHGDLVKMDEYNFDKLKHLYEKHGWTWRLFKVDNFNVLKDYEVVGSVEKTIKA